MKWRSIGYAELIVGVCLLGLFLYHIQRWGFAGVDFIGLILTGLLLLVGGVHVFMGDDEA